jgi:hypothetical protein
MSLGVVEAVAEDCLDVRARAPDRPVRLLRLGKMWAEPIAGGCWRLLEKLEPSWIQS